MNAITGSYGVRSSKFSTGPLLISKKPKPGIFQVFFSTDSKKMPYGFDGTKIPKMVMELEKTGGEFNKPLDCSGRIYNLIYIRAEFEELKYFNKRVCEKRAIRPVKRGVAVKLMGMHKWGAFRKMFFDSVNGESLKESPVPISVNPPTRTEQRLTELGHDHYDEFNRYYN